MPYSLDHSDSQDKAWVHTHRGARSLQSPHEVRDPNTLSCQLSRAMISSR